jgi:hypothetical protein
MGLADRLRNKLMKAMEGFSGEHSRASDELGDGSYARDVQSDDPPAPDMENLDRARARLKRPRDKKKK